MYHLLERQTGHTVKRIRSDNGGEFINNDLDTFYKSKGIQSETTVSSRPSKTARPSVSTAPCWTRLAEYNLPKHLLGESHRHRQLPA
jgi:hypothetical protein